ncbi:MAG: hypothetical protein GF355_00115, partial [Candidatus Eisenbacteria bacterium]|nr:hypothetical protein [Candidatus Eisenbacteria bacterium]
PSPSREGPTPITITTAPEARDRIVLGWFQMAGVDPNAPQDPIHTEFERLSRKLQAAYKEPAEAATLLRPARDLYKALGIDPSKHRPSSEALFRRLVKGKGLYRVNAVVDAGNLCSVRMMLSVGLYDARELHGPVVLRVGEPGEAYDGIGKGRISVEGRWTLADAEGPFGNPTADSWRTRIREMTESILFVIFAPRGYEPASMSRRLEECAATVREFCGGELTHISRPV